MVANVILCISEGYGLVSFQFLECKHKAGVATSFMRGTVTWVEAVGISALLLVDIFKHSTHDAWCVLS